GRLHAKGDVPHGQDVVPWRWLPCAFDGKQGQACTSGAHHRRIGAPGILVESVKAEDFAVPGGGARDVPHRDRDGVERLELHGRSLGHRRGCSHRSIDRVTARPRYVDVQSLPVWAELPCWAASTWTW